MKLSQDALKKIILEEVQKLREEESTPTEPIIVSAVDVDGEVVFTMTWPRGASKDIILKTLEGQLAHPLVVGFDAESGVDWLEINIQENPDLVRAFGQETEQDKIDREQDRRLGLTSEDVGEE